MLDSKFCNGKNCNIKNICQRYTDFLYKIDHNQDITSALTGTNEKCSEFSIKRFVGN